MYACCPIGHSLTRNVFSFILKINTQELILLKVFYLLRFGSFTCHQLNKRDAVVEYKISI